MKCLPKPCPSCPWRVDSRADRIPGFQIDMAEGLVRTTRQDGTVMACHQSQPDGRFPCAGWLARYGRNSIAARLAVAVGEWPAEALTPGPGWPELFETYDEMMANIRATEAKEP